MKKILFVLMGLMATLPAFAESQNELKDSGITIWVNDISPSVLPPVDYSTVSADTKSVELTGKDSAKSVLRNITVDGSIRVRYSMGDRPSFSTQRIAVNYNTGKVGAGVVMQKCERF